MVLAHFSGGICYTSHYIGSTDYYTLTVDFEEPMGGFEIPAICILNIDGYTFTVIPVKFEKEEIGTDPA